MATPIFAVALSFVLLPTACLADVVALRVTANNAAQRLFGGSDADGRATLKRTTRPAAPALD